MATLSPHWPEWKAIDTHLQIVEKRGLRLQAVLRTRLGIPNDFIDGHQLLPKYCGLGPIELRLNV